MKACASAKQVSEMQVIVLLLAEALWNLFTVMKY